MPFRCPHFQVMYTYIFQMAGHRETAAQLHKENCHHSPILGMASTLPLTCQSITGRALTTVQVLTVLSSSVHTASEEAQDNGCVGVGRWPQGTGTEDPHH